MSSSSLAVSTAGIFDQGYGIPMQQLEPVVHSPFIAPYESRISAIFHKL